MVALLALAYRICRDGEDHYVALSGKMDLLHNPASARVFTRLATLQADRAGELTSLADSLGLDLASEPSPAWDPEDDETVSALSDTDYLMTPYKALQLAVLREQESFRLFSALAANTGNADIQARAELFAHRALEALSLLRADRRLAYRSEPASKLAGEGLSDRPASGANVEDTARRVDLMLGQAIAAANAALQSSMSDVGLAALSRLRDDYPADAVDAALSDDPVQVLKGLLLEFETAVDLFLRIAETGKTELVVEAAHGAVERYLGGLSVVRDQLDYLIHRQSQQ